MKKPGSTNDPLWFKDAVIYELHVRAFFDSNGDGAGDLAGLAQKLDYLQDLGVTCLWLLPFFPSPLRDDGYDISDYNSVHPMYGTIEDFKTFLDAAHERGLQVMIELVMNHTSDQHPWFQAARQAPRGSPERDFYVWSDTGQEYRDARIIFTDTEKSNWSWDPVAQAYYWHRFFSHQPDLNYDSPRVIEEMFKNVRFWLDIGVDALRLDAIPYLVERDGTNCENLPETHKLIKQLRGEIDERYGGRMILAEANQWPADVRPYFGQGDECHMAFHFPLMPRIYMALRQEDRLPITDIMAQTPAIPDTCQWGLFLRNHDELTLEMVTNDERDYMYLAYSADSRMRINLGIRRRLAPLVDNNRRRIELLNSILFSFPGTPILYYGDEIGMGDNIYLGDRNGVRTPMQWNADRNAGFSRANPAKLYSPVIMDPVWAYEAINVEAQQSDPSSLLNWVRNMIALRKLFRGFGRGTLEFLNPVNRKVLAYLRRYDDEVILCVANLSRFAQPVDLDLAELEGSTPVEMLGYVQFPRIERQPYRLTLAAYGFFWLELHAKPEPAEIAAEASLPPLVADNWEALLEGAGRAQLETLLLPAYLEAQHWFPHSARRILSIRIADWMELTGANAVLTLVEVRTEANSPEIYLVPLALANEQEAETIRQHFPAAIVSAVTTRRDTGVLFDATLDGRTSAELLAAIGNSTEWKTRYGFIRGAPDPRFAELRGAQDSALPPRRSTAEQRNTSIVYDDKLIFKLFRRQQPGPNTECEIGKLHFDIIPPYAGSLEYENSEGWTSTLAALHGLVANEGDAWTLGLEEVERYYENSARVSLPEDQEAALSEWADVLKLSQQAATRLAHDHVGIALDSAARIGRCTAELHLALAHSSAEAEFQPEGLTLDYLHGLQAELENAGVKVFDQLRESIARLPEDALAPAGLALGQRKQIMQSLRYSSRENPQSQRIRIHGDYHLRQLLRVRTGYVVIDFEGDPNQPIEQRRAKQSPLKDVATMLRSFSRVAYAGLIGYTARRPEDFEKLEPWARLWERSTAAEFLRAYFETAAGAAFIAQSDAERRGLLATFWLESVLDELAYELSNRPSWARIALSGILLPPIEAGGREWNSKPLRTLR
jgi:maltose alpha-D-glucosyltransferase/alpha-amylase